jgi:hypothetical protein
MNLDPGGQLITDPSDPELCSNVSAGPPEGGASYAGTGSLLSMVSDSWRHHCSHVCVCLEVPLRVEHHMLVQAPSLLWSQIHGVTIVLMFVCQEVPLRVEHHMLVQASSLLWSQIHGVTIVLMFVCVLRSP